MPLYQDLSYEDFPRATEAPEGMLEIEVDRNLPSIALKGDIIYARRNTAELRIMLLYPIYAQYAEHTRTDYPCLLHIHGSGWRKQDIYRRIPALSDLAARGYVIASVQYRASEEAGFPAQVQDAKAGLRWLRMNAREYGGDPRHIAVMGDSSGGHTALLTALTEGDDFFDPGLYPGVSDHVDACLDLYGPVDIASMMDGATAQDHTLADSPEGLLFGRRDIASVPDAELIRADCSSYVAPERDIAPILILHGDKDDTVCFSQSVLMYEALRRAGKDVTFYKVRNAGHGGPEFWTKELLDIYDAFFIKAFKAAEPPYM